MTSISGGLGPHLDDEAISAALDSEATGAEVAHLSACGRCQARMEQLRAVADAVGAAVPPRAASATAGAIIRALARWDLASATAVPAVDRPAGAGEGPGVPVVRPAGAGEGAGVPVVRPAGAGEGVGVPVVDRRAGAGEGTAAPSGGREQSAVPSGAGQEPAVPSGGREQSAVPTRALPSPVPSGAGAGAGAGAGRRRAKGRWAAGGAAAAAVAAAVVVVLGLVSVTRGGHAGVSTSADRSNLSAGARSAAASTTAPAREAQTLDGGDLGDQSNPAAVAAAVRSRLADSTLGRPSSPPSSFAGAPAPSQALASPPGPPCAAQARAAAGLPPGASIVPRFVGSLRWQGQPAVVEVYAAPQGLTGVIMRSSDCARLAVFPL